MPGISLAQCCWYRRQCGFVHSALWGSALVMFAPPCCLLQLTFLHGCGLAGGMPSLWKNQGVEGCWGRGWSSAGPAEYINRLCAKQHILATELKQSLLGRFVCVTVHWLERVLGVATPRWRVVLCFALKVSAGLTRRCCAAPDTEASTARVCCDAGLP